MILTVVSELLSLLVHYDSVCTPVTDVEQLPDVVDLSLVRSVSPLRLSRPYVDRTQEAYVEASVANQRLVAVVCIYLNLNECSEGLVLLVGQVVLTLLVALCIVHTDVVQNVVCRLVDILLRASSLIRYQRTGNGLVTTHPPNITIRIHLHDSSSSICLTILLDSLNLRLVSAQLYSPLRTRSTVDNPLTLTVSAEVCILALNRQCEAEIGSTNELLVGVIPELIKCRSLTICLIESMNLRNNLLLQPVLLQILEE